MTNFAALALAFALSLVTSVSVAQIQFDEAVAQVQAAETSLSNVNLRILSTLDAEHFPQADSGAKSTAIASADVTQRSISFFNVNNSKQRIVLVAHSEGRRTVADSRFNGTEYENVWTLDNAPQQSMKDAVPSHWEPIAYFDPMKRGLQLAAQGAQVVEGEGTTFSVIREIASDAEHGPSEYRWTFDLHEDQLVLKSFESVWDSGSTQDVFGNFTEFEGVPLPTYSEKFRFGAEGELVSYFSHSSIQYETLSDAELDALLAAPAEEIVAQVESAAASK